MRSLLNNDVAMTSSNKTRPGWFTDGQPAGMERYWDGHAWGAELRPVQKKKPFMSGSDVFWILILIVVVFPFFVAESPWAGVVIVGMMSPIVLIAIVLWLLWRAGNRRTMVVVQQQQPVGLQPGWYPDMHDPKINRWWDGRVWTSATLPRT